MSDVDFFKFPTLNDGIHAVEETYCHLVNAYRNGERLEPEAIDWMDAANTWLMTSDKL